jgi:hypothetical protein
MNRTIFHLWLCSLLIVLSSCGTNSENQVGGIEGSGIATVVAVTSAGVVTDLGSIFVNGVEYDLAGAAITLDGQPASERDLDVGSIVIVEGTLNPDGTTGRAARVTAGTAVAGPIDSVSITHEGFMVLGQMVEIDAATFIENETEGRVLGGLTVGSDVEVSGFADSSGTIRARRIAQRPAHKPLIVTGYVADLDSANDRFAVNGAIIDYTGASVVGFDSGPLDGAPVRVTATVVGMGGAITAEEVAHLDLRVPGPVGGDAIVQGWVTRYASPNDFDVDGRRVVATPNATVPSGVALDAFVVVSGEITSEGAVDLEALLAGPAPKVRVTDVEGNAIEGANVTITGGGAQYQATTDANGIAVFTSVPAGEQTFMISAPGFDTQMFSSGIGPGTYFGLSLEAEGEWAIGTPIVLRTRLLDRAVDGSTMAFSVDLAVIDERSEAIQTLTSADFSIGLFDCGWGGERDCASDADGNHTGNWGFGQSPRSFFGLQPPAVHRPYLVDVLAVRSDRSDWRTNRPYWETLAPALKSFVSEVGGSDSVSLSRVGYEGGVVTHTVLGPFTSDGTIYFDVIDQLAQPAGHDWPPVQQSLTAAILRAADARDQASVGTEPGVLILGQPFMSLAEINAVATLAQQAGVSVSTVEYWTTQGARELAMRTGGFVAEAADTRQFPTVFSAMDRLLAGAMPFYRMEFELTGEPETFVAGGNAQVQLHINVPTSFPSRGIHAVADVAIP